MFQSSAVSIPIGMLAMPQQPKPATFELQVTKINISNTQVTKGQDLMTSQES